MLLLILVTFFVDFEIILVFSLEITLVAAEFWFLWITCLQMCCHVFHLDRLETLLAWLGSIPPVAFSMPAHLVFANNSFSTDITSVLTSVMFSVIVFFHFSFILDLNTTINADLGPRYISFGELNLFNF